MFFSCRKILHPILAVLLVFQVSGAHWVILQSIAWMGMMVQNIQKETLQDAVSKTFDGEHPCKMCVVIEQGKKSEGKQEVRLSLLKQEFIDITGFIVFSPPQYFWENDGISCNWIFIQEGPLTPPPQQV